MATFLFKCGACGVFFATLSAMQTHLCDRTLCSETAWETDEASENGGEEEVNSEQPATQASENHGFLDLPVTIIEKIFSFIPQNLDWWKTLRFVCKSFEEVVFHNIICVTIQEGDFPSHSFTELKKLQELKVIFECCSLTGSEFLENVEKLLSLKTLQLVGNMFTYADMMHLCYELQFMYYMLDS